MMPASESYKITLQSQTVTFELRRSNRRSIGFRINSNGLQITAPHTMSLAQIKQAVTEKSPWILRHLSRQQQRNVAQKQAWQQWETHGQLPYLGVNIQVIAQPARTSPQFLGQLFAPTPGDTLMIPCEQEAPLATRTSLVEAWLKAQARVWFDQRLHVFLQRSGSNLHSWRLSNAKTRWGSCSSKKRVNLNWRLIHFERIVIDYVIAHEVAHLRFMHHGPKFWEHLQHLMPDFSLGQTILKDHQPGEMPALLPLSPA